MTTPRSPVCAHLHDDEIIAEVEVSEVVGPYSWGIIHHAAESFPCDECAAEGGSVMRVAHDLINVRLGRPPRFPEDVERWSPVFASALGQARAVLGEPMTQAYKKHLITSSLTGDSWAISKDGQHIAWASSLDDAKATIDMLTSHNPSDKPTCSPSEAARVDRCVADVEGDPNIDEPFALCVASIGCKV